MDLIVEGGVVPSGAVLPGGSKHAAIPLLFAACLSNETSSFCHFPRIGDTDSVRAMLEEAGVLISQGILEGQEEEVLLVNPGGMVHPLQLSWVNSRDTYFLIAPQVMRFGEAYFPWPGGCNLGVLRHTDYHEAICTRFGLSWQPQLGGVLVTGRPRGCHISIHEMSFGATVQAILLGAIAEGTTTIQGGYAASPDIQQVLRFVLGNSDAWRKDGSRIVICGSPEGISPWHEFSINQDGLERFTWEALRAMCGPFCVRVGVDDATEDSNFFQHVASGIRAGEPCRPFQVGVGAHPGLPSDLGPILAVLGLSADGSSMITDYRHRARYQNLHNQMVSFIGDRILRLYHGQDSCLIRTSGPTTFRAAEVNCPDLRAGAALLLAALKAEGTSRLHDFEQVQRGYEDIVGKLTRLGFRVRLVEEGAE